jgi:hypothetical protein
MQVSDLFTIDYGQSLSLNKLNQVADGEGIAFVSRTAKNNGISAWVSKIDGIEPLPDGLLTVCLRSRNYALSTFVQPRPFYCGYHIYVLTPRKSMSLRQKLWWAKCIEANRYRYNFGRQANRTLESLTLPDEIPDWVEEVEIPSYSSRSEVATIAALNTERWKPHVLQDIFDLHRGRHVLKRSMRHGSTAYIGASASNNGVTAWIDEEPDYPGGQITLSNNGSVGEAFYQPYPFIASGDVTVLEPKSQISVGAALFVCTVLYAERFRWNYGRKWAYNRMKGSVIRLPTTDDGLPDWDQCATYMTALPLAEAVLTAQTE